MAKYYCVTPLEIFGSMRYNSGMNKMIIARIPSIDLGQGVMPTDKLSKLMIKVGVIDSKGIFYDLHEWRDKHNAHREFIVHGDFVAALAEQKKIKRHFIRVATSEHEGTWFAPASTDDDEKRFILTREMAVALYNGVQSQNLNKLFEENLADYASDFGYNSRRFLRENPIFDKKLFDDNMTALRSAVGRDNFDKEFFRGILSGENML